MQRIILLLLISILAANVSAQKITISKQFVQLSTEVKPDGVVTYAVQFKGKQVVLPSSFSFKINKPATVLNRFKLLGVDTSRFDERWQPIWGEEDAILNSYAQLVLHLQQIHTPFLKIDIQFRVFADGVGFRYVFPQQNGIDYFVVQDEQTQFRLTGDHTAFWIPGDYDTNEYAYEQTKLSAIDAFKAGAKEKDILVTARFSKTGVQTPLQMKSADGLYINIHEAALVNYPAMQLLYQPAAKTFVSQLVPDAVGNKAYVHAPFSTPWRTVLVSDRAADLLLSRTILNLNEPNALPQTDFIRPQKFLGMWWEMHIGKATWQLAGGKHGANTANVKRYIDFAAQHGFDGVLIEGWNIGWEDWIGHWKENVFDFITPYPDYDINHLVAYAKEKNVQIIMHHETSGAATNYERWMDTAYRFMINHNMRSVKTGYVGQIIPRGEHHDGQWMVNHYNRVIQKAAKYGIMIDAHEPVRPTGLHRTYPNFMAAEASRGAEFNNAPTLGITPAHNTILPFTRLMGGPMDYTPGLFHMQLNQFEPARKQRVRSTLAKQLALYVTMYSPMQMAADLPENYEQHLDAFQFIKDVPVNWSETKVLFAEPGDYITIARRAKAKPDWFIGGITDEQPRQQEIVLDFLETGKTYRASIYRDAADADYAKNPEAYTIEQRMVQKGDKLLLRMAAGGGFAISLIAQ